MFCYTSSVRNPRILRSVKSIRLPLKETTGKSLPRAGDKASGGSCSLSVTLVGTKFIEPAGTAIPAGIPDSVLPVK